VVVIILVITPESGAYTLVWVLSMYAVSADLVNISLVLSLGKEKVENETSILLFFPGYGFKRNIQE